MKLDPPVLSTENTELYFHKVISKAIPDYNFSEDVKYYLESLLLKYLNPENFLELAEKDSKTLVEHLYNASEERSLQMKIFRYISIGDRCLIISGFLNGYVNRKMQNIDYCVDIGRSSYDNAVCLARLKNYALNPPQEIFSELSRGFPRLVFIIREALSENKLEEKDIFEEILRREGIKTIAAYKKIREV